PSISNVWQALKVKIPEYMVPASFVFLQALPLSPNGKIDRAQLPPVSEGDGEESEIDRFPLTMMEELVQGVWSEVLDRQQIGRHQNFFDLGGHSLLATRVISRLKAITGQALYVKDLFEHPTLAQLAASLEHLMRGKEWLSTPPIEPVARQEELPLSFAQQRLWFIEQMEPGTALYVLPFLLRLLGTVQVPALEHALHLTIQRHEGLRTIFPSRQGIPRQVILPRVPCDLPLIDLSALAEPERTSTAWLLFHQAVTRSLDLEQGPLLRVALVRSRPEEHVLVCCLHHIIADGWSLEILLRELALRYTARVAGEPETWPPLPIQYADFAAWQRDWLRGEVLDAHLGYWSQRLAGAPALLNLPTDHPRPSVQTSQGAHVRRDLPAVLCTHLAAWSRQMQASLFMSLLTGFALLLARVSGQDDLVIGTPSANRTHRDLEGLIGFFANTLPIRVELGGTPSCAQVLQQVRTRVLEASAHQEVPFERLVEHMQPERRLSHAPLVQVLLVFQAEGVPAVRAGALQLELLDIELAVARFDLTLTVRQREGKLACDWEYPPGLFERETVQGWSRQFQQVLEGMVQQPEQSIRTLALLTPEERDRVLEAWNATRVRYPRVACVQELFEEQVSRTPDAIALAWEHEQLSYAHLNRQANRLAHVLQRMGVGPEVLVGVCVERSLFMIVGILAVLKAGGAFLPMDPSHPYQRLDFILQDSRAAVLLTRQALIERLPGHHCQVLCLDAPDFAKTPASNPSSGVSGQNIAYAIYTSGSTGQPKGVLIPHS